MWKNWDLYAFLPRSFMLHEFHNVHRFIDIYVFSKSQTKKVELFYKYKKKLWRKCNGEVHSDYTPVEQKQHKKQSNDQWRLLLKSVFAPALPEEYSSDEKFSIKSAHFMHPVTINTLKQWFNAWSEIKSTLHFYSIQNLAFFISIKKVLFQYSI